MAALLKRQRTHIYIVLIMLHLQAALDGVLSAFTNWSPGDVWTIRIHAIPTLFIGNGMESQSTAVSPLQRRLPGLLYGEQNVGWRSETPRLRVSVSDTAGQALLLL